MALPPDVDAKAFADAIKQFQGAVGVDWVFTSDDDVALYKDAYSPFWGEKEEILVSAAVAPNTAEEVSQVVRIANTFKIPIYPISTGKNLGYGGSAPNLSGSVVLDLKRMNRIIEVDDKRHFAIVEPGVAYFDLYRYIQERGLKVQVDVPDPGWGSLIGNALDHGVGYGFGGFRDHFYSHCGMEVVLPNGEIVRTGMGALPGAKTWAEYHYGVRSVCRWIVQSRQFRRRDQDGLPRVAGSGSLSDWNRDRPQAKRHHSARGGRESPRTRWSNWDA